MRKIEGDKKRTIKGKIDVDRTDLDKAIEKAKRLDELLKEAQQTANSLCANKEIRLIKERSIQEENECAEEVECVFHWLNSLYQNYLKGETAGEPIPCDSCSKVAECQSCPPVNFNIAGEKYGLKIDHRILKHQ